LRENNLADETIFFLPRVKFNVEDKLRPSGHNAHKNNLSGKWTHRTPNEIKLPPYLTLQRAKLYHKTPRHMAYVKNLLCSQSRNLLPLQNPMIIPVFPKAP